MVAISFGSGTQGYSELAIRIMIVFFSIAFYNVIELTFIIYSTFKRHSGLYFWSFVVATWGIPVYCGGFLIKYFASPAVGYLAAALILVGWVSMVTGQSVVLWSRLHIVMRNRFRLKLIMWAIIFNAVVMHGAVIPMTFGSFSSKPDMWKTPYSVMEKIQVTVFFIQETIISGFYIGETVKLMRLERTMGNARGSRRLMNHLILVNILIILLDITILGFEYANQYQYQTSYKAFVYSAKLKLEFTILNRLVEMTTGNKDAISDPRSRTGETSATKTGTALDTFTSDTGAKIPGGGASCQAHAMGVENPRPPPPRNNGVMMTTEIVVEREDRQDYDGRSMEGRSSASLTVEKGKGHDEETMSRASSEIHFASRSY